MIAQLAHHWALPDKLEEANAMLLENGRAMRAFPGFIARQTLISESDPLKITTVIVWRAKEDHQAWLDSPERKARAGSGGAGSLWSRPVEAEYCQVIPEA